MNRLLAAAALLLCSTIAATSGADETGDAMPTDTSDTDAIVLAEGNDFELWKRDIRERAIARGIPAEIAERGLASARFLDDVVRRDRSQPEFSRRMWEYLDAVVTDSRIDRGQEELWSKRALLDRLEARFGVPREIVLAIWAIETGFGSNFGQTDVFDAVTTLAYDGRRQAFFEREVFAALELLSQGDVPLSQMVGSWAGAMGHTQLIPSNFLKHAIDFDGDGRRNLWSPDAVDALASTANFLAREGWRTGEPVLVEVALPAGFNYADANQMTTRPADQWSARGVRPVAGGALPPSDAVAIVLFAGADAPAFALYQNFEVIKIYNRSNKYAAAVARLAHRIAGGAPVRARWPVGDRHLPVAEVKEIQRRLVALGYDTGGVDGFAGPATQFAAQRFQESRGMVPDGYVSQTLLDALRQ